MKITEEEVRALRAGIYGECTDSNWSHVREKWLTPENVQWLKENQPQ